jgi:hypothetical protein
MVRLEIVLCLRGFSATREAAGLSVCLQRMDLFPSAEQANSVHHDDVRGSEKAIR